MENSESWKNTKAGKALETRLNDEHVVHAMNRILDRLDAIENTLNTLHEAPGMVCMVADMADDTINTLSSNGIDIDERLKAALQIAEKLTAPEMVQKIDSFISAMNHAPGSISMAVDIVDDIAKTSSNNGINIDERLRGALEIAEKLTAPEMVANINNLVEFSKQAPSTISMVVDIADDAVSTASKRGVDVNERLQSALVLAEKLTAPKVVEQLTGMLSMMDQSSGLIAMAADSFDSIMQTAIDKGIDPQEFAGQIFGVTTKLASLMSTDEMKQILESGIFDVQTLKIMGAASEALVESNQAPSKKVGMFGMLREMKDSDMQRALGFLTTFGRLFGKKLG